MRGVSVGDVEQRLTAAVQQMAPQECWPFTGYCDPNGYGRLSVKGDDGRWIPRLAHRVAWEIVHGSIPSGAHVLHHCDNPPCCNPFDTDRHLYLGDHTTNMAEMAAHGRASKPGDFGEKNGRARLTDAEVADMRRRCANGERQRDVALRFGVTQGCVSSIVTRRTRRTA